MKKIISFLVCVIFICLLVGCAKVMLPSAETEKDSPAATAPETTAPVQPETTAPTETKALDAETIYWNARFVNGSERATQYTVEEIMNVRVGAQGVYIRTDVYSSAQVVMSSSPFAVNRESHMSYKVMELEIEETVREYYRRENDKTVLYYHSKNLDQWGYEVLDLMPSEISSLYSRFFFLGGTAPEEITLVPETQTVYEREAYVLSWPTSGNAWFVYSGDENVDAAIDSMVVPVYYYIDVETYELLKVEVNFEGQSEALSRILRDTVAMAMGGDAGMEVEINTCVMIYSDLIFDPVAVPQIPEAGTADSNTESENISA